MREIAPKQQRAILALLESPTIQKAASQVGISEATLYRWLSNDAFKEELKATKQKIVGHAIARIQNATGLAVDALVEILGDKNSPPSTRVAASRVILEITNKAVEIEELQSRLDRIEGILRHKGNDK
ncbi:MAG: hypothetical protein M0036_12375 [Desulfobacteraceae bacterium]|nr:hypothetical protein [Desulfobacteraceae bacterium]